MGLIVSQPSWTGTLWGPFHGLNSILRPNIDSLEEFSTLKVTLSVSSISPSSNESLYVDYRYLASKQNEDMSNLAKKIGADLRNNAMWKICKANIVKIFFGSDFSAKYLKPSLGL